MRARKNGREQIPEIVLLAMQRQGELPVTLDRRPPNFDLIGRTYRSSASMVRVISLDPGKPESSVVVQDLLSEKEWTVPSGVIRRIVDTQSKRA